MASRKQNNDKALAEEARRIAEQEQTLYKKNEGQQSFALSVGSKGSSTVASNIDPLMLEILNSIFKK